LVKIPHEYTCHMLEKYTPEQQPNTSTIQEVPAGVDPITFKNYNQLIRQHAGIEVSNNSIEGGVNPYYNREKFDGQFDAKTSIQNIQSAMTRELNNKNKTFRACGRYHVQSIEDLMQIQKHINTIQGDWKQHSVDLRLEYVYPAREGYIVGIGANSDARYYKNYDGALLPRNANNPNIPKNRTEVEAIQQQRFGRYEDRNPINPAIRVISKPSDLSAEQQYQLAILYINTFGPGWTLEAVQTHNPAERPIRIGVNRKNGEVMAAAVADIDHLTGTIEFTEWVSKPSATKTDTQDNAARVAVELIDEVRQKYPEYTLYGEFRTTNGSLRTGNKIGFGLPPAIKGIEVSNILHANVPVNEIKSDFAALVYSY